MTQPGTGTPHWPEVFRRVIALEAERGFNNSAVIGGMDRFRHHWRSDLEALLGPAAEGGFLLQRSYSEMDGAEREQWSSRWLQIIGGGHLPAPISAPLVSTAGPARSNGPSNSAETHLADAPEEESSTGTEGKPAFRSPPSGLTVDDPVGMLKGVSDRTATRLERLEVLTVRDLLYLFPRRHEDYSKVVGVSEVVPGQECTVIATVAESRVIRQGPGGRRQDTEGSAGRRYRQHQGHLVRPAIHLKDHPSGSPGRHQWQGRRFQGSNRFRVADGGAAGRDDQARVHTGRLVPVYPLTEGINARSMRGFTWEAIRSWLGGVEETLPQEIDRHGDLAGLMPLQEAIFQGHYPDDSEVWQAARSRLAFDELLTLQLAVLSRREVQEEVRGISVKPTPGALASFLDSLPFELTGAQARCIEQITTDMENGSPPMNRLLQGEVGSGKTVVALAGLLSVAAAGYQGALMAPTEVLAEQHFRSVSRLLGHFPRAVEEDNLFSVHLEGLERPVSVGLLTGSVRAPVKRLLTRMAADGMLDLLIGTQALIQEGVSIPSLALAVADEQHRFGVMQRTALSQRGVENAHTLIMSATPIPRTLSLTLYGDLDISTIDELPAGRQQVKTHWVPQGRREEAYEFVRGQVGEGRQAFVVCPLIDESASIEAKAATEEYGRLSGEVFPDLRVGLLHGRMSSRDKEAALRQFGDGGLDVLVTTAVVEVGIDFPNASVMLIEGAERFGLAQLHQFRGRVGRGEHRSYCFLLSSDTQGSAAKERLSALERTHDGFELAEIDLRLRGPGDFFGTRQSGLPALRMAQFSDRALLELAREVAMRIEEEDPGLQAPEHSALAAQVARFVSRAVSGTT